MSALPETLDAWSAQAKADASALAARWVAHIGALPAQLRRATLLELLPEAKLAQRMESAAQGCLSGVPFLAKDLYDIADVPTRAGSTFLESVVETPKENAELLQRMEALGGVCAGKTQLVEFAYGMTGENPHYGDCPHPFVPGALAGGSSSASAWAVASGLVPVALGTDTAGSVRVPAAFCGVYGLRLVPGIWAEGVFPLAPSFDAVGWLTRDAQTMRTVSEGLLGQAKSQGKRRALYLGQLVDFEDVSLQAACKDMASALGAEQDPELAQWLKHGFSDCGRAYFILSSSEAAGVHAQWLDVMKSHYDPEVWGRLNQGRLWHEQDLALARNVQTRIKKRFAEYFESYDALVLPITPRSSPSKAIMDDAFRQKLLALNTAVSLAGLPALSVPVKLAGGRSGGLQIVFPSMERMDVAAWL